MSSREPSLTKAIDLPKSTIDYDREKRTLRQFDVYVLPQMVILILIAYLDRSKGGNAVVLELEESLNVPGHQFNENLSCTPPTRYSKPCELW
jgi:hypothetical protein